MCGFIGYISNKSNKNNLIYEQKFEKYFGYLKNRGPDFQTKKKIITEENIINIGFSRLAIQDLSQSSNQIFMSKKKILLFNGEIYNKLELYNNYINFVKLNTQTDTEILFHLLDNRGSSIIPKISGIFSIIFIDMEKNNIIAIKDVTCTKPLYNKIW